MMSTHRWQGTAFLLVSLVLCAGPASADYALNLTPGVTSISHRTYDLHMLALWICTAIGIGVFGCIAWIIVRHRKSRGVTPAQFHDNTRLEVVWTVVPFLVLVALAIPATSALIAMEDTRNADLTIKVTGQQWRWRYDYLNEGVGFFSNLDRESVEASRKGSNVDPHSVSNYLLEVDQPLVVPVGKKVRFLLTATDVIHSWWVPALGYKRDAIPGFINEVWARVEVPGTYRGQCTELCGVGHGFMPVVLVAKSDAEFGVWLAGMRSAQAAESGDAGAAREWGKEELMAKGQAVYGTLCASCHQPNGEGIPGVFKALKGSPVATGPVAAHIDRVLNGKPGTTMQAFGAQLNDVELAAVISYERNSWGNGAGDLVQPAQIKAARK